MRMHQPRSVPSRCGQSELASRLREIAVLVAVGRRLGGAAASAAGRLARLFFLVACQCGEHCSRTSRPRWWRPAPLCVCSANARAHPFHPSARAHPLCIFTGRLQGCRCGGQRLCVRPRAAQRGHVCGPKVGVDRQESRCVQCSSWLAQADASYAGPGVPHCPAFVGRACHACCAALQASAPKRPSHLPASCHCPPLIG